MKLVWAKIKNFRLLKDITLDFSADEKKPLTVIRAANESGKTTAQTALLWGLYGSTKSLKGQGKRFSLAPADSVERNFTRVEISVEIEFETDISRSNSTELERKRFRLKRICFERPSTTFGEFLRDGEKFSLYEVRDSGTKLLEPDEAIDIIESALPEQLIDVYFTDGDSALAFIESAATQGVKRQRVKNAIESLLGLRYVESAIKRLSAVAKKFGEEIDSTDYRTEFTKVNDKIISYDEDIAAFQSESKQASIELEELKKEEAKHREKLDEALKLGDREALATQGKQLIRTIENAENSYKSSISRLTQLTKNQDVAFSILSKRTEAGFRLLTDMNKKKLLPKLSIPLLEELLEAGKCYCGEDISESNTNGYKRRTHIQVAIKNSAESDLLSQAATDLFYSVRSQPKPGDARKSWMQQYKADTEEAMRWDAQLRQLELQLREVNGKIDEVRDNNVKELRDYERILRAKRDSKIGRINELSGLEKDYSARRADALLDKDRLQKKMEKSGVSTSKIDTAQLCQRVFDGVFDKLRTKEIAHVSREMNHIFLEMIGADPEQNRLTSIRRAELTPEFDIKVFGQGNHPLDPDTDLNGASRRAITLALILALTKSSKVEAPNVIDTPLGMTSGYVKQSIVNSLIRQGSQIILFLTHSEISGIEKIIDGKAGKVYTLTNPGHYPKMLVNRPRVEDSRVERCECNHRQSCYICERRDAPMEQQA